MSDDVKFGLGVLFVITLVIGCIAGGTYFGAENEYRQKALAASTELAKARVATEPLRACNERLDAILVRLDRIERAVMTPGRTTGAIPPKEMIDRFNREKDNP